MHVPKEMLMAQIRQAARPCRVSLAAGDAHGVRIDSQIEFIYSSQPG